MDFISANVPDPTDFPPNNIAPGLRTLDGSFRCNICGELYDAPVTLNCGHCFCSFCIRTSLAEKQECPTCRKTAIEGHLRPNPVVEEVVSAWTLSRPYILSLSKEEERQRSSPIATPRAKRRRITVENAVKGNASTSSNMAGQGSPSKSKRQSSEDFFDPTVPTSEADEDDSLEANRGLVNCPLCNKHVRFQSINQHMDAGCRDDALDSSRSAMVGWKKLMAPPSKGKQKESSDDEDNYRLPKVSYATLKDRQIKEMLAEQGLLTTGDRSQCIHRHQRWVMVYNANLDRSSKIRKSKSELRKELKRWEEEKSKKKKTVVDDIVSHEKRHKDEFERLVDAARHAKASPVCPVKENDKAENSESHACSTIATPINRQGIGREEDVVVVDSEGEQEMT